MFDKKTLNSIAFWLVIIGAIDTGLFGLIGGDSDIINYIFTGNLSTIAVILETLIGVAGVYLLINHFSNQKESDKK